MCVSSYLCVVAVVSAGIQLKLKVPNALFVLEMFVTFQLLATDT